MSHPAVSVPTGTPLRHVAREMAEYGVGSVLVTEGGTLRGIVTDRDLALGAVAGGLDANDAVDSLMTSPVVTVSVTDDIHAAYRTFRGSGFRRLPVLDGQRVVGMLTVDDMLIDVFQRRPTCWARSPGASSRNPPGRPPRAAVHAGHDSGRPAAGPSGRRPCTGRPVQDGRHHPMRLLRGTELSTGRDLRLTQHVHRRLRPLRDLGALPHTSTLSATPPPD
ncbi:CBS domain-containing protein [Streptomyces sp. NBC_00250]|uniref:CBS domain-containing protein n=1 Tax=Streptomyces sp. NBC_00250 TaxID=2903641 RepID=UPI002E2A700E|nr:CBS domain-containing protein [Streptomyces sp. NBC_00250]